MIRDSGNAIFETVVASIRGTGGLSDGSVHAGDRLKDLGLTRLWLLAVLIELEDKFGIEFPSDVVDGFRSVGDITFYIHANEMTSYDELSDEYAIAA